MNEQMNEEINEYPMRQDNPHLMRTDKKYLRKKIKENPMRKGGTHVL